MTRRLAVLLRFEVRKLLARRLVPLAFLLVAFVAVTAPRAGDVVERAAAVSRGRVHQDDPYDNGWTALAGGVGASRLLVALVVLVLAASAVAEETSHGTLKTVLLRPVRRVEVLLAKAAATWAAGAALLVVAVGAAAIGAERSHGLYDVVDPLFRDHVRYTFGEMLGYTALAAGLTLVPLGALAALGLVCSTLLDHPGHATGTAVAAVLVLSGTAGLADADWVFVTHLGAPFATLKDLGAQYAGASHRLAAPAVAGAAAVSAAWAAGLFGVAALVLARRDVPG